MDTSETYIKMCEKAEEIQKLRMSNEFDDGDWFYDREEAEVYPVVGSWWYHHQSACFEVMGGDINCIDTDVWLPRQDQLQEMLWSSFEGKNRYAIYEIVEAFKDYTFNTRQHMLFDPSMEQLWLAFVMKEKYDKTWNGEKWK